MLFSTQRSSFITKFSTIMAKVRRARVTVLALSLFSYIFKFRYLNIAHDYSIIE